MVTEQSTRTVQKAFRKAGWAPGNTNGSHTKWWCPAETHHFSLPDGHRIISPGVVRKVSEALSADTCGNDDETTEEEK